MSVGTKTGANASTNIGKSIDTAIDTGRNIGIEKEENSTTCIQNNHISDSQLESFISGKIADENFIMLLEHAGQCTFCAEQLGEAIEEGMMSIMPPAYLKDQIREQVEHLDVVVENKVKQTSKRLQLLFYSFRVAATVSLAVVMLCVISVFPKTDMTKVEAARLERYQEKIERDQENLAAEYGDKGVFDDRGSFKDFIKDNLGEVLDSLLEEKNRD